jgi:hypothetical protein
MIKLASLALTAALGVAGLAQSAPLEAHPYLGVGIGVPTVPVAYGPAYYGPYRNGYGQYWRPGFERYGRGHYYRHWNRC